MPPRCWSQNSSVKSPQLAAKVCDGRLIGSRVRTTLLLTWRPDYKRSPVTAGACLPPTVLRTKVKVFAIGALIAACLLLHAGAAESENQANAFFDSTNLLTFRVELDPFEYGQLARRPK